MLVLNKIRIVLACSLFLVFIFRIIIPGYKEIQRQKKVSDQDIINYMDTSSIITLDNYDIIDLRTRIEKYFDGTPFIKKGGYKTISTIKDNITGKIYKIEVYRSNAIIGLNNNHKETLTLSINNHFSGIGTTNDPIIALRYTTSSDFSDYVNDKDYLNNIREYLTYKNYTPPETGTFSYYLILAWILISIFGFATITGVLNKKMHRIEQKKFKTDESLNKGSYK